MAEISFQKLQELTGYNSPGEVAAHLSREGVRFFRGKHGRPYTFSECYLQATGIIAHDGNKPATPERRKLGVIK